MDYLVTLAPSIIAALTILLAYLQNRDNNKSKRSEIAFEKRVEAFREIYKAISDANENISEVLNVSEFAETSDFIANDDSGVSKLYSELLKNKKTVISVYHANRVYLPPHIDSLMQSYISEVLYDQWDAILDRGSDETEYFDAYINQVAPKMSKHTLSVISEMHKFIGFK